MSKKQKTNDYARYEIISQQDKNDDVLIPIPPALLNKLKWKEGDDIQISIDAQGKFIFTKKSK